VVVGEHHRGATRCKLVILWAHFWAAPLGQFNTRNSIPGRSRILFILALPSSPAQNPVRMRVVLSDWSHPPLPPPPPHPFAGQSDPREEIESLRLNRSQAMAVAQATQHRVCLLQVGRGAGWRG
jgi:hypothetical protein